MCPKSFLGYTLLNTKTPQLPTSKLEMYCCLNLCYDTGSGLSGSGHI